MMVHWLASWIDRKKASCSTGSCREHVWKERSVLLGPAGVKRRVGLFRAPFTPLRWFHELNIKRHALMQQRLPEFGNADSEIYYRCPFFQYAWWINLCYLALCFPISLPPTLATQFGF